MGGLAPDNTQPMDDDLKQAISSYWYQIEKRAQVSFNHDFWRLNTPYRSTYPACRAVIAADRLIEQGAVKMAKAIQSAYYLEAKNPSLEATLVDCASSIGITANQFIEVFKSASTEQQFEQHLTLAHQLQVTGFPALFYIDETNQAYPLAAGYCQAEDLQLRFAHISSQ